MKMQFSTISIFWRVHPLHTLLPYCVCVVIIFDHHLMKIFLVSCTLNVRFLTLSFSDCNFADLLVQFATPIGVHNFSFTIHQLFLLRLTTCKRRNKVIFFSHIASHVVIQDDFLYCKI